MISISGPLNVNRIEAEGGPSRKWRLTRTERTNLLFGLRGYDSSSVTAARRPLQSLKWRVVITLAGNRPLLFDNHNWGASFIVRRQQGGGIAESGVSIAYADGIGSFLVLLAVAEQEGLFQSSKCQWKGIDAPVLRPSQEAELRTQTTPSTIRMSRRAAPPNT